MERAIGERLHRISQPGTVGEAQFGAAGLTFNAPPGTRVALFQLSGELCYPDLAGAGISQYTVEPTPYAAATMIWCCQFSPLDQDGSGNPICSYGGTSLAATETIYHPGAFRNSNGYAMGLPSFGPGDRVWAVFNRQSGRWEILAPALGIWRFELAGYLMPGGSATAYLLPYGNGVYAANTQVELTVYDAIFGTLRGQAAVGSTPGTRGYAQYFPDSGRWEILTLEQKARWIRFSLAQDMGYQGSAAQATVLGYWDGENPAPQQGQQVTVRNIAVTGQYLFSGLTGNVGIASYDVGIDQYWIVQLECPT
jgi:hypothetical protein